MWNRDAIKCLMGALILIPKLAWSDVDTARVFLLANKSEGNNDAATAETYFYLDRRLSEFILAQNLETVSILSTTKFAASFSQPAVLQAIRSAGLSGDDFAITYSIEADITENAVSRTLKARAEGTLFNAGTREALTTFNISTPESIPLPKDKSACPQSCLSAAISELRDDLAREMSFVLVQKISFIQEDRVVTDTTDATAIKKRLSASTARKPVRKTVTTSSGNFDVDVARSINIEVYFDFDSAALTPKAIRQLKPLGEALSSADLDSGRYLIIGHTDAKGSATYNQTLSEKRAVSVRKYLVERFLVLPNTLVSIGLGETQLKRPAEPNAGINRRVEVSLLLEPTSVPVIKPLDLQTYTLNLTLFATSDVLKIAKALEAKHAREVDLLKSNSTSRTYSVETKLSSMELEEVLLMMMLDLGLNVDSIRIAITGNTISVENL